MRVSWETAEALALAPGQHQFSQPQQQQQEQQQENQQQQQQQQHQQQQPTMMEEQRLPLHLPTTPAWSGITDRIVKEEPVQHNEDKNNDSGVSPDHYTSNSASPGSRRSSSTANCSLSPGSATSQDSNAMQCGSFDYSPSSIYKNCDSSVDYGRVQGINELTTNQENEHSAMDVVLNGMKSSCDESEVAQDVLQCPVCPFTTLNRLQFTEHLTAHYAANCETPDFTKSQLTENDDQHQHHMEQTINGMMIMDEANRASPSQGERSEQESEEADEPGLRVPRVNSQGKVKKFRCKQCNFVAITKLEFWEHSRGHIRAEKLLTCPKCPFVTEYKHHLEYHLRNHFGSKPFKCDKCSYSCVNKSMLNSHLKSHSNVYQYRCANCSYATKYCHSLKLHLRKYCHQPAMVLNADGSPNPLPIIDVYGTRRGPKQKPANSGTKIQDDNSTMTNSSVTSATTIGQPAQGQSTQTSQLSPVGHHLPINPMMQTLTNTTNQGSMTFSYNQMFNGFPMSNHYQLTEETTDKQLENLKTNLFVEYAKAMAGERMKVDYTQEIGTTGFDGTSNETASCHEVAAPPDEGVVNQTCETNQSETPTEGKVTPLDLSKPDIVANNNNNANTVNNMPQERIATNGGSSNANSPKTSGTSRRKGRAVKLDRRIVEDEDDDENDEDNDGNNDNNESSRIVNDASATSGESCKDTGKDAGRKETTPERNFGGVGMSNEFTCQYCEIAFGNVVMYTVHMGYHGYKDPYTCNMCGHVCDDKVSFFLHIARSKHS